MIKLLYLTDTDNLNLIEEEKNELYKFNEAGIKPVVKVWNDVDWNEYKYILIRTVWDYSLKSNLFLEKIKSAQESGSIVLHSSEVINWNIDKSYLLELQNKNLGVVRTKVVDSLTLKDISLSLENYSSLVVKPKVGAGGLNTFIVNSISDVNDGLIGMNVLIQPFIPEIQSIGEFSYIFFDGEFSHCVLKKPKQGEFRVQDDHGGSVEAYIPSKEQISKASLYVSSLNFKTVYARVDVVESRGVMLLMELELIEPELFFRFCETAMASFIESIKKHLSL
jgi:glutathione synthase/RimK-type ligase-like ATP-grasp enzyme